MHKNNFRKDINGLRAIAVIAVIMYHFGVNGFSGGFIGVDVFFVISGFLMTGIITTRINQGTFRVFDFYLARAKRIFPALLALCITLLILGWFFLLPGELKELGKQVKSSALFFSNQLFMQDAGYFDSSSHEKWLLHTWSLSVEWQFYVLFPLLIFSASRLSKHKSATFTAIMLIAASSFLASSLIPESKSAFNFYSIGTRAWEMAIGGLVFLTPFKQNKSKGLHSVSMLGIATLLISIIVLTEGQRWPGPTTLLPVIGCAIIIWSNSESWILNNKLMQWCGKTSYSLYLWHWPIAVALTYFQVQEEPEWIAVGIVSTIALGALSYTIFEQTPQKFLSRTTALRSATILAVALLCIAGSGQIFKKKKFPERVSADIALTENEAYNKNPRRSDCLLSQGIESPSCNYGGGGKLAAIVLGDSHANSVVTAVAAALPDESLTIQEWSYASCPTIFGAHLVVNDRQCREFNEWASSKLKSLDTNVPVIIVNRSSSYPLGNEEGPATRQNSPFIYFSKPYEHPDAEFLDEYVKAYTSTICEISKHRKVFLVRPFPEMPLNVPKQLARKLMINSQSEIYITMDAYKKRHSFVYQAQDAAVAECGAEILDPIPYLCEKDRCNGSEAGRPYYYDASHLSEFGNRRLIPMFHLIFKSEPINLSAMDQTQATHLR